MGVVKSSLFPGEVYVSSRDNITVFSDINLFSSYNCYFTAITISKGVDVTGGYISLVCFYSNIASFTFPRVVSYGGIACVYISTFGCNANLTTFSLAVGTDDVSVDICFSFESNISGVPSLGE